MVHDLRALLRLAQGRAPGPTAAVIDSRTLRSTPESGSRAGYDGAKRKKGSKVHAVVDTLGHLLALRVTSATEQDRAQVEALAEAVQSELRYPISFQGDDPMPPLAWLQPPVSASRSWHRKCAIWPSVRPRRRRKSRP